MNAPINDGGAAFPRPVSFSEEGGTHRGTLGMTLRDYFAGQALAQLIKREIRELRETHSKFECFGDDESDEIPFHTSYIASESYAIADAMLAARERKEDSK